LALRPRAIALIDGVFESTPSVWHREIIAALEAGVAVFGAASMGALRAAELRSYGMVGIGRIYDWAKRGLIDDAAVALLHAGKEHGHRPLSLPLVDVLAAAEKARRAKALTPGEARALTAAAAGIFYQERSWPRVLEAVGWGSSTRARWQRFARRGLGDIKGNDARACLAAAARWVASGRRLAVRPGPRPSSLVRRRRLWDGASLSRQSQLVSNGAVVEALIARADAPALAERGLRRALLAGWGREQGLKVEEAEVAEVQREWRASFGVSRGNQAKYWAQCGLDEAEAFRLAEDVALERRILKHAARMISDGPSWEEGLADEARLTGLWPEEARRLR
jgi:hypothetical protein